MSIDLDLMDLKHPIFQTTHKAMGAYSHQWIYGVLVHEANSARKFILNNDGTYIVAKHTLRCIAPGKIDKNGKELFDGDIIKVSGLPIKTPGGYEVVVDPGRGVFVKVVDGTVYKKYRLPCSGNIELIGNTIEHPDLLTPLDSLIF